MSLRDQHEALDTFNDGFADHDEQADFNPRIILRILIDQDPKVRLGPSRHDLIGLIQRLHASLAYIASTKSDGLGRRARTAKEALSEIEPVFHIQTTAGGRRSDFMGDLADAAHIIAEMEPDDRAGWVVYVLEAIDEEIPNDEMRKLINSVKNSIITRLASSRW